MRKETKKLSSNNYGLTLEMFKNFHTATTDINKEWFADDVRRQGTKAIKIVNTFVEMGITDKNLNATEFGKLLQSRHLTPAIDILFVHFHSTNPAFRCFVDKFNADATAEHIEYLLTDQIKGISKACAKSNGDRIVRFFKEDGRNTGVFAKFADTSKEGRKTSIYFKGNEVYLDAVIYGLYTDAAVRGTTYTTISAYYKNDEVLNRFGLSKAGFEKALLSIQECRREFVIVDLKGGLDNIYLRDGYTAIEAVKKSKVVW